MISVGTLLKEERVKKGLSLRTVEKSIRVREKFLKSIEENDWNAFSSEIYITGILSNYAKFLSVDKQKVIAFFRRDYERRDDLSFKKSISSHHFTPQTKRLVYGGIVAVLAIFLFYFGYQLKQFLSPPSITIMAPMTNRFRSIDNVVIRGKTEKEASITIFGERIYPNKDGVFEYVLPLHTGKNELIIEVIGGNGKKNVVRKEFVKE
ncbi:helix-turn-helix domain-containing protein [Candidatus Roizmanbacteria bacterium]|nr:helix-turn-helix domain-containing protein [Candidatus Roizmanbacteria bacterium]